MAINKSISTLGNSSCCGCYLCADACPKGAITFQMDIEGFFYPIVNEDSCINCGICSQKCPALNVNLLAKNQEVISAYAKESIVRDSGSSGGVFGLLAESILKQNGKVYGAAFDKSLNLKHQGIEKEKDLRPLCKSKYLQSNCYGIYRKIKEELKLGKLVMFCGTPCQCQALSNYLNNKQKASLLLVDFVCHGVPNQRLFDDNINWNKKKYGNVKYIEFRYKGKNVLHPQTLKMVYEKKGDEKTLLRMHYQDPYYFGFQKHIFLRPSCYECQWSKAQRCSDITLADFWGIEKTTMKLDSKKGVSCLLINTPKGNSLFISIKSKLNGVNVFPINFALENNDCLGTPTKKPKNRDDFFSEWNKAGYDIVVSKYLTPKRKWIFDVYYNLPSFLRRIIRRIMDKRMKYE